MHLERREFLKAGSLTALGLGLNLFSPAFLRRRLLAGPAEGRAKLVFLFQRGGNDGVNTLIPHGDPEYSRANRPSLYISRQEAVASGNGFASLHPMLAPMAEIYNRADLNGADGPGNLAILHRIGYDHPSQSHFDSQQFWENGVPGNPALEEGMLYRHIERTMDPKTNRLVAAAISGSQMVALKGALPIPTIRSIPSFTFAGSPAKVRRFLGRLPSSPVGPDGRGLLGAYGGPRDSLTKPYRDLVYGTGLALTDAMTIVQEAVAQGDYTPTGGAEYPPGALGSKLEQVAMLLKRTPVRILGVNLGGWDTHTKQGKVYGHHGKLLGQVAQGFQALSRDLADQWNDLVVITMSEFGRTSRENGSGGTDHAYATCMFVAGGRVKGGVYNCDPSTWAPGDLFSGRGRYLAHRTDFRAVFAEIFQRHFGDSPELVEEIIPGYGAAATARPGDFEPLGFLPA